MKNIVASLLAITIHFSAFAEPSKTESIKELLELTNVDSMIDTIYAQMDQMFSGMGAQMGVKASEQDILENYMSKIMAAMTEEMSWDKMEGPMIDIYANNYTEQEIQDMLIFYRSKTGRSLIEKMPAVMGESMMVSQKMVESFMPRIKEIAAELAEELRARRATQ